MKDLPLEKKMTQCKGRGRAGGDAALSEEDMRLKPEDR